MDPFRDQVLACEDLQLVWGDSRHLIASFKTYFWWDVILHNEHYEETLAGVLGRDHLGVIRAWEQLSPLLFRPVPVVTEMVGALERAMLPGAFRLGVHVRMGNAWYDQADADCRDAEGRGRTTCSRTGESRSSDLPVHTARCAVGVIPHRERARALVWLLVSDSAQAKSVARYFIADVEGHEVERHHFYFGRDQESYSPAQSRDASLASEEGGGRDELLRRRFGLSPREFELLQTLQVWYGVEEWGKGGREGLTSRARECGREAREE